MTENKSQDQNTSQDQNAEVERADVSDAELENIAGGSERGNASVSQRETGSSTKL